MGHIVTLTLALLFSCCGLLTTKVAFAQNCDDPQNTKEAIQCGSSHTSGVPVTSAPETALQNTVNDIVKYFTFFVGAIAVIMIIYGGFKFVTSSGDPGKVATAKSAVIYGLIGLAVVGAAQVMTRFFITYFN